MTCQAVTVPATSSSQATLKKANYLGRVTEDLCGGIPRTDIKIPPAEHLLLGAQDQRLGVEQGQRPYRSKGTSSGNCQETDTCMVRACQTQQQPLKNHRSGHLGGWVTPWSEEEMLDGQHQRVDIPAHAKTAHKGLLQKKIGRGSLLNRLLCPPDDLIGEGTELN